jgi:hypothetical protein
MIARFEADKVLFQKWAQCVGICQQRLMEDHHKDLNDPQTASMVEKILPSIQEILTRTDKAISFSDYQQILIEMENQIKSKISISFLHSYTKFKTRKERN